MKVNLLLTELPHYRLGVFYRLSHNQDGIRFRIISSPDSRDESIKSISPEDLPAERVLTNVRLGGLWWQRGAVRAAFLGSPDALIATGDVKVLSTWVVLAVARVRRIPIALWTIGWHRPERGLKRYVRLCFYTMADRLLMYGERGKEFGVSAGYPGKKMTVIGNSVDLPPNVYPVPFDIPGDVLRARVIVSVGRLTTVKNLALLIEAVADERLRSNSTILLAGAGPDEPQLRETAQGADVDLRLLGSIYEPATLAYLYKLADVAVIPGAAGLGVIQALHHGVPVIVHDGIEGQMPEAEAITPGVTGDTFARDHATDLASKILKWTSLTTGEREKVAQHCRKTVAEGWNPQSQASRITEALSLLAADSRATP